MLKSHPGCLEHGLAPYVVLHGHCGGETREGRKGCGNPVASTSVGAVFPKYLSVSSLSHFGTSYSTANFLITLLFVVMSEVARSSN